MDLMLSLHLTASKKIKIPNSCHQIYVLNFTTVIRTCGQCLHLYLCNFFRFSDKFWCWMVTVKKKCCPHKTIKVSHFQTLKIMDGLENVTTITSTCNNYPHQDRIAFFLLLYFDIQETYFQGDLCALKIIVHVFLYKINDM